MKNTNLTPEENNKFNEYLSIRPSQLIMHNDDVNTFTHVMFCLVKFCGHDEVQAEQCALLIHHTGSCDVKRGPFNEIKEMEAILKENNLSVTIVFD